MDFSGVEAAGLVGPVSKKRGTEFFFREMRGPTRGSDTNFHGTKLGQENTDAPL